MSGPWQANAMILPEHVELKDSESDFEVAQVRSWPTRWLACLMAVILLCTAISAPVLLYFQWWLPQEEGRSTSIVEETTVAVPAQTDTVNQIVYITQDGQVATISPDGQDDRMVTAGDGPYLFPAWSPDGRQIAFIGNDAIFLISQFNENTTEFGEEVVYQSSGEPPFYLYWSPDSRYLSFLTSHIDSIALHILDIGGADSRLLAIGQPFYWDWSPAGTDILIHSGFIGEGARLTYIDPAVEEPLENHSSNIARPGYFQAPGISPSGKFHAFAEISGDDARRVVIQGVAGSEVFSATHEGQVAMNWSPQRDRLAFIAPDEDAFNFHGPLTVLDPANMRRTVLSSERVLAFFWSPDGRFIAYLTVPIFEEGVHADSGMVKRVRYSSVQSDHEQILLDLWVVDTGTGETRLLTTFRPTSIFLTQFLPYFDQYALSHRIWSPYSDAIVLPKIEDNRPRIVMIPADGSPERVLGDGVIGFWSQQ